MLLKRAYAIRPYGKCDRIARDEIPTVIPPKTIAIAQNLVVGYLTME